MEFQRQKFQSRWKPRQLFPDFDSFGLDGGRHGRAGSACRAAIRQLEFCIFHLALAGQADPNARSHRILAITPLAAGSYFTSKSNAPVSTVSSCFICTKTRYRPATGKPYGNVTSLGSPEAAVLPACISLIAMPGISMPGMSIPSVAVSPSGFLLA